MGVLGAGVRRVVVVVVRVEDLRLKFFQWEIITLVLIRRGPRHTIEDVEAFDVRARTDRCPA